MFIASHNSHLHYKINMSVEVAHDFFSFLFACSSLQFFFILRTEITFGKSIFLENSSSKNGKIRNRIKLTAPHYRSTTRTPLA